MRHLKLAAISAVTTLCTLAACGRSDPLAPGASAPGGTAAQRYTLLGTTPICPPSPGGCTAAFGSGLFQQGTRAICFSVVAGATTDAGLVHITIEGITYSTAVTNVVFANNGVVFSAAFVDTASVPHTVFVNWSYEINGDRQVSIDNLVADVSPGAEGVRAGQCEPEAACAL